MRKILVVTFFVFILLFSGCKGLGGDSGIGDFDKSGKIVALDDLTFDMGDISISGGVVEHGFNFKNDGDSDLNLMGAKTSCICTTVRIELPNGSLSPEFGMDTDSTWNYLIAPGEEFEVEVFFDPMGHGKEASGPVHRSVFLYSSSELNGVSTVIAESKAEGTITEMDIHSNILSEGYYERKYGDSDFVFDEMEFDFGVVKQSGGVVSYDFEFTYMGDDPIEITSVPSSCICTSGEISKTDLVFGDKGVLTVKFDPNLHEEPNGKFFKTVVMMTEPAQEGQPEIKIWAEIDLDLGPEAFKIKEKHVD